MFDTVRLGFNATLEENQLIKNDWFFVSKPRKNGERRKEYYTNLYGPSGISIHLTYYPQNLKGEPIPTIIVEFSILNWIFGNNIRQLQNTQQIDIALNHVNEFLMEQNIFFPIYMHEGIISRIDICYDHNVGNRVNEYITVFRTLNYPHRETNPYLHEGVQFLSKKVTTKFYNKYNQALSPEAYGILRQETTIRSRKMFNNCFGSYYPTLETVSFTSAKEILRMDLERLKIDDAKFCNHNFAEEILGNFYGNSTVLRLIGFMTVAKGKRKEQIIEVDNLNRSTINRNLRMLKKAGISCQYADTNLPLLPLTIK